MIPFCLYIKMQTRLLAIGLYTQTCTHFEKFYSSCLGCRSVTNVVLLDRYQNRSCNLNSRVISVLSSDLLSTHMLALQANGVRVNFQKTIALFRVMSVNEVTKNTKFFMKTDDDTLLNVHNILSYLQHNSVLYFGKSMKLFKFRNSSFTYMQGGAYILHREMLNTLFECKLPTCINKYIVDTHNHTQNNIIQNTCNTHTLNSEDLYVGICMHNVYKTSHRCFMTTKFKPNVCRCPFSLHPLKKYSVMRRMSATWSHLCY